MPKHPHEALLDELIRLIFLKVAEDLEPGELNDILSLNTMDPRLTQKLKAHGDSRHAKLMSRKPELEKLKASRVRADGQPDYMSGIGPAAAKFMQANKQRLVRETQK